MITVVSAPESLLPREKSNGMKLFSQYARPAKDGIGWFARELPSKIRAKGFSVDQVAWDFLTIALSAFAADRSVLRKTSPDGWTREIKLVVHVCEPLVWRGVVNKVEQMLRFLTGDFWHLDIQAGGTKPPMRPRPSKKKEYAKKYDETDCVALLSGGMDSLIGCIDLVEDGRRPIFVSQVVPSNAEYQRTFADSIRDDSVMLQFNHSIKVPDKESETSTRGRSIVFFAFAAIAACAIRQDGVDIVPIYVSENGFISLNVALNSGRVGSLSTKTTHPSYMKMLSEIWDAVGIKCKLILPYRFKTKGEMVKGCKNRNRLVSLMQYSTSCSRFATHERRHCGRCVPCLVRAAAFQMAGIVDHTDYKFLTDDYRRKNAADDVGAMAGACLRMHELDFESTIAGDFLFAPKDERVRYKGVYRRGLAEVEEYLKRRGVLS